MPTKRPDSPGSGAMAHGLQSRGSSREGCGLGTANEATELGVLTVVSGQVTWVPL